ncbi:efflux RND transporter permease subunit [Salinisphaera sp.]|uniref:efflux RND transporter permease subunit n=1 Tax=Salinisphaera sp. TaxID=1914330 RepID=UPI000C6A2A92|nr:efflux RND transporter permease subunit [Salinisphaera sp.]MBS62684.1 acriflavine resistance protein B [Salinisphaera sp.]
MNISQLALRYWPVVLMLVVVATVAGVLSYFSLPTREDPEITIREAVVTTHFEGLSAERVELLITKTLEEAIRQVPEVEQIRSTSMPGTSIIHVEIQDKYFDLEQIWDEMRHKIEAVRNDLPEGATQPRVNDDFGDVAVVTAALTADDFSMSQMFDMAQHIRDRLYTVKHTQRVDILGVQPERIYIETTNARLAEMGLDPERLIATLADQNIIRPGGAVDTGGRRFAIEPSGQFEDIESIREALIALPDSDRVVPLQDIATVERGYLDPPGQKAYYNGRPALVFSIAMLSGNSVIDYGADVKRMIATLQQDLPAGYQLDIATFQAEQVANTVYGVTVNVLQTLAIVLAVVILFLGLRTGVIVGSIVPAVMLASLAVMGFFELSLQRMSLATLVIALGLLVDNGIVIAEDFKRRLEEGASRDDALKQTGDQMAIPLLSSTLTTILVFLPLMLAEHVAGEYTRSISLVILITLLMSWLLAMGLTPLLCYRFIRVEPGTAADTPRFSERLFRRMNGLYETRLRRVMQRPLLFVLAMLVLLIASVVGLSHAPAKFFPDSDRAQILVYVDRPAGSPSTATDAAIQQMMAIVGDAERFPYVRDFAAYVGFGGPRFVLSLTPVDPAPFRGFMVLNIDDYEHMNRAEREIRAALNAEVPSARARVKRMFLGPSDSSQLQIQIKGPDADYIYAQADRIESLMATVAHTIDIRHDWENRIDAIRVDIDQARARRAGVTSADVARSMSQYFDGRQITEFREGDDIFPIVLRAADAERHDLDRVKSLSVFSQSQGHSVPLEQIAAFELVPRFGVIAREDMARTVTVEARNTQLSAEDMLPQLQQGLDEIEATLAAHHHIEIDGVVEESAEGQAALSANFPLCAGAMLLLLVIQFNGYRRPLIIVATLPLLLIGAVIGLYAMQANFGFMEILGLYALAGILLNNGIVLLDQIEIERAADNTTAYEAVICACVRRLRPIMMTTITTILGLLPLIIFHDALFYGMASVLAFGLAVGTLLTLGVVPVLYCLVFRVRKPDMAGHGTAR